MSEQNATMPTRTARTWHIATDMIEITTANPPVLPDPDWVHVDAFGHEHRFVDGELPTLEYHSEGGYDDDAAFAAMDDDDYDDLDWYEPWRSWWSCRICEADVVPHYISDPTWSSDVKQFMPGLQRVEVEGTSDEFEMVGARFAVDIAPIGDMDVIIHSSTWADGKCQWKAEAAGAPRPIVSHPS